MGYTVEKLLDIARKEIGYIEKETNANLDDKTANAGDGNWTKYARDLHKAGYYQANKNGYAWCDCFVDWCHLQAADGDRAVAEDTQCQTGPYGAGCDFSHRYYDYQGRYFTSNPQAGDQIFFGDFEHTGIIEKVENGVIYTIEGNTSNQVKRKSYSINSSYVTGFGRPKYAESNLCTTVTPKEETTPVKYKVGDIVDFTGTVHYASANATTGPKCKGGLAKITAIYQLGRAKHPYHLIRESGSGATVYGWVDEGTFTKTEEKKYYRVRKSWNDAGSQVGAYESLEEAKKAREKANPYHIYDWDGNEV